jgi:ribosomal protein S18 acetylase RimI-like enzyme
MQDLFPVLVNYIDARNVDAIGWLQSLGFTVEDALPHGPDRLPFHKFSRSR